MGFTGEFASATRVIARAEIVLDSAMHVGAGEVLDYVGARSIYRNGRGLPVIPGTTLAGVFFERAQRIKASGKLCGLDALWPLLTEKSGARLNYESSILNFSTAGLVCEASIGPSLTQVRDLVHLDPKTRTADDGAKFAFEVLEPGLRFELLISCELDRLTCEEDRKTILCLLTTILFEAWGRNGMGRLGGNAARGMGWFHLEGLQFAMVNSPESLRRYLDAGDDSDFVQLCVESGRALNGKALAHLLGIAGCSASHRLWGVTLTPRREVSAGKAYGRWPVIVRSAIGAGFKESDFEFDTIRRWRLDQGSWSFERVPVIPGSSLRGAARALLTRLAVGGMVSWDRASVDRVFGDTETASPLLFKDALFNSAYEGCESQFETQIERIALDEFTRGVYGSAKFNYTPIFSGAFQGTIALEESSLQSEGAALLVSALFEWGGEDAPWLGVGAGAAPMVWKEIHHV